MTKEERKNQIRSEGVEFYTPQGGDEADDTLTKEVIVEIIERNLDSIVHAADSGKSTIDVEKLFELKEDTMSKEESCVEEVIAGPGEVVQADTGSPTVANIGEWRADSDPITFEEAKERVDGGDTVFSFAIDSSSYPPRLAVTFVFSISTGFLNRVSLFDQLFIKDPTCFEEYQRLYCFLTVEEPSICTLDVEHTFKRPDNRHWYVADTRMLSRIICHLKEFTIGNIRENKEQ